MYHDKRMNVLIVAASAIALVVSWVLIRQQTAISDRKFLGSDWEGQNNLVGRWNKRYPGVTPDTTG